MRAAPASIINQSELDNLRNYNAIMNERLRQRDENQNQDVNT